MEILYNGRRLKCILDSDELSHFGLNYDILDYNNEKTKSMMNCLLESAEMLTDFKPSEGELCIEVFPAPQGGCIVWFSAVEDTESPKSHKKKIKRASLFVFETSENLLSSIETAKKMGCANPKSQLFEIDGKYYLIVLNTPSNLENIFYQFGTKESNMGKIPFIREHGKLICENALSAISAVL